MSCYLIRSKLNGMVLDIKKADKTPGTPVITYPEHGGLNQLWYDDLQSGTIRSKLTDFCLDLDNDMLVCRPYEEEAHTQKWMRDKEFIRSRGNREKVLDIYGEKKSASARVGVYKFHGKSNQQWEFVTVPSSAPNTPSLPKVIQAASGGLYPADALKDMEQSLQTGRREFWIVSALGEKVVDICGENTSADAKVILYDRNPNPQVKNQLWYLDGDGFIRSCLNDYVFLTEDKGKTFRMVPYKKNPRSQWIVDENKIFNRTGECLEVRSKKKDDIELGIGQYKGNLGQHWAIKYFT